MRLNVLYQFIRLLIKLPNKTMTQYTLYWQPQLQSTLASNCSFIDINLGVFHEANIDWIYGWYQLDQYLNENQFNQVDAEAESHVCIDVRPSPVPPGSPHGR